LAEWKATRPFRSQGSEKSTSNVKRQFMTFDV
jgi:hypothetical protein